MASNDQVGKYFDTLLANFDIVSAALTSASDRGIKVTRQVVDDAAASQREAIQLVRKVAADPSDLGKCYGAMLEAATSAQGRALALFQLAFQETVGASADARATFDKLVEANKDGAQAAAEMARTWAAANPMAELVRKGFEAVTPRQGNGKQQAAPA
jgi:hypothetical protein